MILLRSLAFHIYFYSLTFALCLASIPVRALPDELSLAYAKFWVRLVLAGLHRICGITLVLTGTEHLPASGPALLACQHQSAYDTLVWMTLLRRPAYVIKQELMGIPLFGPMLRRAGMIGVDRKAASRALRRLLADAAQAAAGQRQIVIFPQGTRVAPGQSVPLQPGIAALAARLGLPVIPVATDAGHHWGRRALLLRPGPIRLSIRPPIPAGTPRTVMLARIAASWDDATLLVAEKEHQAGDNSVGQSLGERAAS